MLFLPLSIGGSAQPSDLALLKSITGLRQRRRETCGRRAGGAPTAKESANTKRKSRSTALLGLVAQGTAAVPLPPMKTCGTSASGARTAGRRVCLFCARMGTSGTGSIPTPEREGMPVEQPRSGAFHINRLDVQDLQSGFQFAEGKLDSRFVRSVWRLNSGRFLPAVVGSVDRM
jgi:hypothetical protein